MWLGGRALQIYPFLIVLYVLVFQYVMQYAGCSPKKFSLQIISTNKTSSGDEPWMLHDL